MDKAECFAVQLDKSSDILFHSQIKPQVRKTSRQNERLKKKKSE